MSMTNSVGLGTDKFRDGKYEMAFSESGRKLWLERRDMLKEIKPGNLIVEAVCRVTDIINNL